MRDNYIIEHHGKDKNYIFKKCQFCGQEHALCLTDDEWGAFVKCQRENGLTQDYMTTLNKSEREFLISGICLPCQQGFFGSAEKSDKFVENVLTINDECDNIEEKGDK